MTKILNVYKQFGLVYLLAAVFKRSISPFLLVSSFFILVIKEHAPEKISNEVKLVDSSQLDIFLCAEVDIHPDLRRQLQNFLNDENTYAVIAYCDNRIAGWGFVQKAGIYSYGRYKYSIPDKTYMLKNLYVVPKFRGRSIGKVVNQARINSIPSDCTPMVFVITENHFAIRNLEIFGFKKGVLLKDYLFFKRYHRRKVVKLLDCQVLFDQILKGFIDEKR